jgi:hypothetical protein
LRRSESVDGESPTGAAVLPPREEALKQGYLLAASKAMQGAAATARRDALRGQDRTTDAAVKPTLEDPIEVLTGWVETDHRFAATGDRESGCGPCLVCGLIAASVANCAYKGEIYGDKTSNQNASKLTGWIATHHRWRRMKPQNIILNQECENKDTKCCKVTYDYLTKCIPRPAGGSAATVVGTHLDSDNDLSQ